ncbi:LysR family transcriptional regulator [Microlunatus sp. GCM10028923]|uniref:LysR family transcriptional regulator n=1 Tax=Microlunatus sp. GCM10028923 TaxID=3273400 RepID=UPI003607715A
MNLDVEDLRVFTALARAGHYGKAAEASCLSRSGVSRAVRRLEQMVGQPLVRRNAAGMHGLTEAGERFVRHAESILRACEAAVEDARNGTFPPIRLIDTSTAPTTPWCQPPVRDQQQPCSPAGSGWSVDQVGPPA